MPQILITDSCQVNFGDDRGGVHQDAGDMPTTAKDVANSLVRAGRALYIDKKDDPDKRSRDTASKEMVDAAKTVAAAKNKKSGGQGQGQGGQG